MRSKIQTITTADNRDIDLSELTNTINKFLSKDVEYVVYKLSYFGKYIYIKGKSLAGSLIIFIDTFRSYKDDNPDRFKGHLYTHFFKYLQDNPGGRFRVKVLAQVNKSTSFYELLKAEQRLLDGARLDKDCLNNQVEVYVPKYNESTGMYGWIPVPDVMNFKKWLTSPQRKGFNIKRNP
jgi:hypothetical protein